MLFNSPKNFKRGRLVNNRYRIRDLVFAGAGVSITLMLLLIYVLFLKGRAVIMMVVIALPAVVTVTAITPLGIYHNLLEYTKLGLYYSQERKKYIWEGIYKYRVVEEEEE